jgi:hypothetical protein
MRQGQWGVALVARLLFPTLALTLLSELKPSEEPTMRRHELASGTLVNTFPAGKGVETLAYY